MLKIQKNKILHFLHSESKSYRNLTRKKGGIFRKMNDEVEIAEDVTFGDFFNLLIKEKELINVIFGASMYGVLFEFLIDDYKRNAEIIDDGILSLEIYWYVSFEVNCLSINSLFHGIERKGIGDFDETRFSLAFIPICELKKYPLKLNETLEIIDYSKFGSENRNILKTTKRFTLFEIIHAILFELTFYGTPEMRDNTGKAILENKKK